ncbi:MAG: hypothetical protein V4563_18135 [Pseudomonadota bacterium]
MASLKHRFEELIHLEWGKFIELEQGKGASVDDVVLCSLIRVCADTDDIASIKLAFDRVDGLLETLIDIKVPKFYTRYVNAKDIEPGGKALEAGDEAKKDEPKDYDPATAKLRETLKEMRGMPRDVIRVVLLYKKRLDKGVKVEHEPMVKSVIVANLLKHVTKGRFRAIELVFDQIDGKLPKAIKLLGGDDVYVDDYNELVAPANAQLGEDGVYYAENQFMTTAWLRGFAQSAKGLEILAEGLGDEYGE